MSTGHDPRASSVAPPLTTQGEVTDHGHQQPRSRIPRFASLRRAGLLRPLFILIVAWFFLSPIVRLFFLSFQGKGGPTLGNYGAVLGDPSTWDAVGDTLYVAIGSTIIATVLGVYVAWLVGYSDIRGKRLMQPLLVAPFVLPPYVVTIAWAQAFLPSGLASNFLRLFGASFNIYSRTGIALVLGITHFPIVYLLTLSVMRRIPRELEQASRAGGAGRFTTFRRVTLVLAMPGIAGGALLSFLTGLDNFGVPAVLGIPAHVTVLSTEIYQQVIGFGPSAFNRAGALAVLLTVIALGGTGIQLLLLRRSRHIENAHPDTAPRVYLHGSRPVIGFLTWLVLLAVNAVPVVSMAMTSLSKAYGVPFSLSTATVKNFRFLVDDTSFRGALATSGKLAVATAVICLVLGTAIAYIRVRRPSPVTKSLDGVVGLPYAMPGIVLALAIIFAWIQPLPGWKPGVYGTWLIILIAYVARFTFYQVRGSVAALSQVDPAVEEAARASGAKPWVVWRRVVIPLILGGTLSGAGLVLLTSLTELTVSSLLYSAGSKTVGVVIFSYDQGGFTTLSTAASTIVVLVFVVATVFGYAAKLLWRVRERH